MLDRQHHLEDLKPLGMEESMADWALLSALKPKQLLEINLKDQAAHLQSYQTVVESLPIKQHR